MTDIIFDYADIASRMKNPNQIFPKEETLVGDHIQQALTDAINPLASVPTRTFSADELSNASKNAKFQWRAVRKSSALGRIEFT